MTNFADIDDAVAITTASSLTHVHTGLKPYSQPFAVFLCGAFAFLDLYSTQPMLPMLSRIFHATEAHAALTISASTIGVAISAALLATLGEGLNRKRTVVLSLITLSICTMLTATATTLNALVIWRFLQGILTPGIFILTIAYVTEEWPSHLVPRVMSGYVAGTVFGGFVGRFLGGIIAAYFGWRFVFAVLGIGLLCGAGVIQRLLIPGATRTFTKHASRFAPILSTLRNPHLLATFGIGFCMLFTLVSIFSYITFYLAAAPFHLSTQALSYLFVVYLFGLAATLTAGTVLAKFGLRNGMLFAIACGLIGVALTLTHSLVLVALGLAIVSSGVFIAQTCSNSFLRGASPPNARVAAAGGYICSYYIGGSFGGILPGHFTTWPARAALTCGILCIAAALAIFGWPKHSQEPTHVPL